MKSLCLIIPTFNRSECIDFYLKSISNFIKNKNIYVVILDSSDNSNTKTIVDYYSSNYSNIIYDEYFDKKELVSIDQKVYYAYDKYCTKCDYMWFSGDGAVLELEKYYKDINVLFNDDYDMIVTDCKDCDFRENKIYYNPKELFLECCWFMTLLSSVIVSKKMATKIVGKYPYNINEKEWLWVPTVYFKEILQSEYKIIHYVNNKIYAINPKRRDPFWKSQTIWQWSTAWCQVIEKQIPEYYDDLKLEVLKSFDKHIETFSFKGLLRLKENKSLSLKAIKENKKAIKKVTETPIISFYLIALLPIKNILSIVKKILKNKNRRASK